MLTVLLCAVGGGVTVAGAAGLFGAVELQRRVVLWGLPLVAAALAAWCGGGGEAGRAPARLSTGLAAALLAFAELTLVLLFVRGGGLVVAGLYRGLLVFTEAFVINDWYSLFFPAANYVADGPWFYVARAATAALAFGLVAALLGRRREVAA